MRSFFKRVYQSFVGNSLLSDFDLLPLHSSIEEVIARLGEPVEANPDDDSGDSIGFRFGGHRDLEIVVWIWRDVVHAIVYYSDNSNPSGDLAAMMNAYGEGQSWIEVNQGHLHYREDGQLKLTCSVMPIYCVGTREYFERSRRPVSDD